jgi:WD40 repeat protein
VNVFSRVGSRWMTDPPLRGVREGAALSSDGRVIASAAPTATGSEIVVSDVASGRPLLSFAAVPAYEIALDWTRRRVVVTTPPGGASDAVWYDLNATVPSPHPINVGSAVSSGQASVYYDATDSRLGINTNNGLGIFDAATLTPLAPVPILPTDAHGEVLFLDSEHVLTATDVGGPLSLWDLSGTSVLATRTAAPFNTVYPNFANPIPDRFFGTSTRDNERSVTVLGPGYRPLGPPIPIEPDLRSLPAATRSAIETTLPAVVCAERRAGRIATVSVATGDLIVRDGTPPFRILSRAPGVAAHLADPLLCAWSPDGRQVAISTYPRSGQAASVGLYNVATKTLHVERLIGEIAVASLFYSDDSKTLWVGGPANQPGVYRVTDPEDNPRIAVAFTAFAISADADRRRLVVAYPTSVRVYDAHTLKPLTQTIAVAGTLLYEVSTSPDGNEAVVAGTQGWRLIDLDAQQPIGPWTPAPFPSATIFGADGTTVYTVGANGNGEIWNLAATNVQAAACGLAGRNLSNQEWHKYLSWAGPWHATCPQYPLS